MADPEDEGLSKLDGPSTGGGSVGPPLAVVPPLTLGDVVPRFRTDLEVKRHPDRRSVFEVLDAARGKAFILYDFEISLARMLNGTRQVREILDAGQRLGIPVTLESFNQFVRQLARYGFLAGESDVPQDASPAAPERESWPDGSR